MVSEAAILAGLKDAPNIKKLNDASDWQDWKTDLKIHLSKIRYWNMLTVGTPRPTHPYELDIWEQKQERLTALRDQLNALGHQQNDWLLSYTFLVGLGPEWASWRDTFWTTWETDMVKYDEKGNKKARMPTINEILVKMRDRTQEIVNENEPKSTSRAFGAKEGPKKDKDKDKNKKKGKKNCTTCGSNLHDPSQCWYTHPEKQSERSRRLIPRRKQ